MSLSLSLSVSLLLDARWTSDDAYRRGYDVAYGAWCSNSDEFARRKEKCYQNRSIPFRGVCTSQHNVFEFEWLLFSPLPFWFSHIGFSHFSFSLAFLLFNVEPRFSFLFASISCVQHFSPIFLVDFCPLDKFSHDLWPCNLHELTHWRRCIKWNKLAKALFIIAFWAFIRFCFQMKQPILLPARNEFIHTNKH